MSRSDTMFERNAEMVRRVRAGDLLSEVAADYGLTRERVRQIVAREGVHSRRSIITVKARQKAIRELWEQELTNPEIAEKLELTRQMVAANLRTMGLKAHYRCVDCNCLLPGRPASTQRCDPCLDIHQKAYVRRTARSLYLKRRKDPKYIKMNRDQCKKHHRKRRAGHVFQPQERCSYCNKKIPRDAHPNRKYCDLKCRRGALHQRTRKEKAK